MPVEYPTLQTAADTASAAAQGAFIKMNQAQLAVLVVVAVVAGWTPSDSSMQRVAAIAVTLLMFVALVLAYIIRIRKFDDTWFRCRAFAENVKTAVRFFAMSPAGSTEHAKAEYLNEIAQINERLAEVAAEIEMYHNEGELITGWMKTTQNRPLGEKLSVYLRDRLDDQRHWYHSRAALNASREKQLFTLILLVEALAVIYAAIQAWLLWEVNLVGAVAALSAAFIAWLQTRRYSDLATTYAVAARDLDQIEAERSNVNDEAGLRELVQDVEAAVSREHSLWLRRRLTT